MKPRFMLLAALAATTLTHLPPAHAGQAPGASSDPNVPISHHDRVYAAEQFSNTISVIDPADNHLVGVIRLGDPTSHGGKVVGASGRSVVSGIRVARVGDPCTCPIRGHSGCTVAEGDPNILLDGIPVAFNGHHTSCGAALITTVPKSGR